MPGPFATATAVQPIAAGQWSASIHPGWDIAGNANGGYLLAMATRALAGAAGRPDPVTVTAHYLSPGQPGRVEITTQILKEGRRFAVGTATMVSGSRPPGRQSGRPLMRGWFRLPRGEHLDSVALLCAVDAFPPTAFNARLPVAWTPTVELTAHIRANPAPGWLRCRFSTRFVTAGFLEEDGEVWDSDGRLVGQSRQLALVPRS
jgi:Thioesterase-like superfamily